jgi:hypothetical protein
MHKTPKRCWVSIYTNYEGGDTNLKNGDCVDVETVKISMERGPILRQGGVGGDDGFDFPPVVAAR